jgi:hypothetical protein
MPPASDVGASLKAHARLSPAIFEKAGKRRASTWAADDPAVKPDAQHFRRRAALLEEAIDTVAEILPELAGTRPARPTEELGVIGIELIRHDELVLVTDRDPVGYFISVGGFARARGPAPCGSDRPNGNRAPPLRAPAL